MPTYPYRCTSCSDTFERWQSFQEDPLTECSSCGGELKRVLSPVGIIFKGGGWYCNDSRPKEACGDTKPLAESSDKCGSCEKEAAGACKS